MMDFRVRVKITYGAGPPVKRRAIVTCADVDFLAIAGIVTVDISLK